MKRSQHTNYTYAEALVYEYKHNYFIVERCQQGVELNPAHDTRQKVSEYCALSAELALDCSVLDLGLAVIKAIEDFDTRAPSFDPWDSVKLSKLVSTWVGARSFSAFEKNCRMVQVVYDYSADVFKIYPYDNHNLQQWHGVLEGEDIILPGSYSPAAVGEVVVKAFAFSTFHPERKEPLL